MSDPINSGELTPTPAPDNSTPAPVGTVTPQQVPDGFIEKPRFDGLIKKVEELTLAGRELNSQLGLKSSEIEQLKIQLGIKETEKSAVSSERDTKIQDLVLKNTQAEKELTELKALKFKLEAITEMGRPDLLPLLANIPNMTDKDALKIVLKEFADFADRKVKEREQVLLAGLTPGLSANQQQSNPGLPTSDGEWGDYINKFDLGSKERAAAMDAWGKWLEQTHKS
jgi:uncharacterized small protein (DUF1192 family)